MKRRLFESSIGDTVVWDINDIYRVQKPEGGSGGGGVSGGSTPAIEGPNIHWPDAIQSTQDNSSKSDSKDDINVIKNIDELTPEEKEQIKKRMTEDEMQQDVHILKDNTPGVQDSPEHNENLKNEVSAINKKAREEEIRRNQGKSLSTEWGRTDQILILHRSVVNWKEKLKRFFQPWITKKQQQTYTRPFRRDLVSTSRPPSVIRPGYKSESPSNEKLRIFATIDTSGSVDNEMLSGFLSEIKGIFNLTICKENNIEVRIIEWTGKVTSDTLLHSANFQDYFNKVKRTAIGATNFGAIKEYLLQKRYFPVAIVHFTDGCMDIDNSMIFKEKGCKNVIVIPEGLKSSLELGAKYFDEVIPMTVYKVEEH